MHRRFRIVSLFLRCVLFSFPAVYAFAAPGESTSSLHASHSIIGPVPEFSPMQGVLVTFDGGFSVPPDFLRLEEKRGILYVLVRGAEAREAAACVLKTIGINPETVRFITGLFDTCWIKDYGPFFVYRDGVLCAVDFTYNRNRRHDDAAPEVLARYFGIPLLQSPMVHTGGNILTDGAGAAISSSLVVVENGDETRVRSLA